MDHLVAHGIVTREREAVWIERKRRYARGELDHNQLALEANGEYARALAGWSLQQADPLVQQFVAETDHRRVYGWAAPLLRAARRQLVVGRHTPALLDALGVTATCIPDPETATAEEVIDLVRSLVNS